MDDNQLGRNIQHFRKNYNETLEELGTVLHCAKSTVKGYENGSRKPDLQTLQLLAAHYDIPVDELLKSDFTGLKSISLDMNSRDDMIRIIKTIFPLYSSKDAMENKHFKKGYELSQRLLTAFYNAEVLSGNMLERIFESFAMAAEELETPEAVANIMWIIFIWWSQISDTSQILSLQNKLLSKKLSIKDYMSLRDNEDASIREKRVSFITELDAMIINLLKILKSEQEWSDLADYYIALRYVVGMVNSDLSNEMNKTVGMQMMMSFMMLGNSYALEFCKIDLLES